MKDKRTYTNIKEYGEDMSYENDTNITHENRGPGDLTLLLEQHKKEIWAWKQKEMEWTRTLNLLEGNKRIVEELTSRLVDLGKFNQNLEAEIKNLQHDNATYKEEIKKLLAEEQK